MDPTNNQMPIPNSVPTSPVPPVPPVSPASPVAPVPPVAPTAPVAPVAPAPVASAPVASASSPVIPVEPEAIAAPAVSPVTPASPVVPGAPVEPVAPAINGQPAPAPITITPGQGVFNPAMSSMFVPGNGGLVGATDPITMPAPPKAPDPVEEELKAPFKAAGPVPGSIGSAISVPPDAAASMTEPGKAPNSVSFNDPAMMNNPIPATQEKKKVSKGTLIALAAVLGVTVIGLAIYLIITLTSGK